jgi:hypothetical protein
MAPEIKTPLTSGSITMIIAPNFPIFYSNTGFTMSMDTAISAASVKDMN